MKNLCAASILAFLVMFFDACSKSDTSLAPAKGSNNNTPAKPASVTQLQVTNSPFVPYTDTFYGVVYQGDYGVAPVAADSVCSMYIYAFYPSSGEVKFSSGNPDVPGAQDPYAFDLYGDFTVNDSNVYYMQFGSSGPNYIKFKLVKDSLYYNALAEECPDEYETYIAAKCVSIRSAYTR